MKNLISYEDFINEALNVEKIRQLIIDSGFMAIDAGYIPSVENPIYILKGNRWELEIRITKSHTQIHCFANIIYDNLNGSYFKIKLDRALEPIVDNIHGPKYFNKKEGTLVDVRFVFDSTNKFKLLLRDAKKIEKELNKIVTAKPDVDELLSIANLLNPYFGGVNAKPLILRG